MRAKAYLITLKYKLKEIRLKEFMLDSKIEFDNMLAVPVKIYIK